jgi:hypothetical protein
MLAWRKTNIERQTGNRIRKRSVSARLKLEKRTFSAGQLLPGRNLLDIQSMRTRWWSNRWAWTYADHNHTAFYMRPPNTEGSWPLFSSVGKKTNTNRGAICLNQTSPNHWPGADTSTRARGSLDTSQKKKAKTCWYARLIWCFDDYAVRSHQFVPIQRPAKRERENSKLTINAWSREREREEGDGDWSPPYVPGGFERQRRSEGRQGRHRRGRGRSRGRRPRGPSSSLRSRMPLRAPTAKTAWEAARGAPCVGGGVPLGGWCHAVLLSETSSRPAKASEITESYILM